MKPKLKPCPICGKLVLNPGLAIANHLAMHGREEAKAAIYGWDARNPWRAARPLTAEQRRKALRAKPTD